MTQSDTKNRSLVLVVEMDTMCRRAMERILGASCRVITAVDYDEIVTLLSEYAFDALIVDNDFPEPGVMALFERARAISPGTKRILMTGENVVNLQHYLEVGTVNQMVTRTTSPKEIERAAISPAAARKG
jgi:DNA-binding NtrC family response regulator